MNYTWDLTKIFKDENEYRNAILKTKELLAQLITYKGRIYESDKTLLDMLKINDDLEMILEKIYVYVYLGHYDNMGDNKFLEYKEEVDSLINEVNVKTSFIEVELLSSTYEKVLKYIDSNKELKKYRFSLENTFRYKKYCLSEKEETLLSDVADALRTPSNAYDMLDNVDIKLAKIKDENNKLVELNQSNYIVYLSNKDRKVRKRAFDSVYAYYKNHINTISSLYIGKVKTNSFFARTRGYKSVLDMYLFPDKVDSKLYENLIKITNKNVKYLKEYYNVKSSKLGIKMHMYDTYVNTSTVPEKVIEYEDAIKIVNNALKLLGEEYLNVFNSLLNNRCVDVLPKDKKRGGAYEWGCYGVEPYVSLNYEKDSDSVSTLAHEMGHAMHTYYSNKNQDYTYAEYPIFLAEIASTVNEILLSDYLISSSNDKDEKIYYIVDFLDKFKATVYRQVMFASFEHEINKMYESGKPITKDVLCNTYYKLNKHQFSPSVVVDENIKYEWARISHFYRPFYVYKYATGFISALIIVDKLKKEKDFKDKYINFLSSGSSSYPLDLLKELGIDISDENTLNRAFELFNDKVQMLKELERK